MSPEINGIAPRLSGSTVDELLAEQFWYHGELVEEFNVVFIRVDGVWHRLAFDLGIIFWRSDVATPHSSDAPELRASYPVVDLGARLGLRRQTLEGYDMFSVEGGSEVRFYFADQREVAFRNIGDQTTLRA